MGAHCKKAAWCWAVEGGLDEKIVASVLGKLEAREAAGVSRVCRAFGDAVRDVFEGRRRDVSCGKERFEVPCANSVDGEMFPFKFEYVSRNCLPEGCSDLDGGGLGGESSLNVPVELRKSVNKGWGVHACVAIAEGTAVCEYVGEVISSKEANRRFAAYDSMPLREGHCLLVVREILPSRKVHIRTNIDATKRGGVARFINHSCDGGNLELVVDRGRGGILPRILLYAKRDIQPGEELSFAYGTSSPPVGSSDRRRACFCGAPCCGGVLPAEEV